MANEITATISLSVNNGDLSDTYTKTVTVDQSNGRLHQTTVSVPPSGKDIDFGDLVEARWLAVLNLDDTNYVDIGPNIGGLQPLIRLKPGEIAIFPRRAGTMRAQADTATVLMEVFALDT